MKLTISFVFISLCVMLLGCAAEQSKLDSPIEFPTGATLQRLFFIFTKVMDFPFNLFAVLSG